MAEEPMDLSGAVEQIKEMLSGAEGQQTLQNIMSMFQGGEEKPPSGGMVTGGIDPESLAMVLRIKEKMDALSGQHQAQTQLLSALRPFLSHPRREKVDSAIKLVQMSKVLGVMKNIQEEG